MTCGNYYKSLWITKYALMIIQSMNGLKMLHIRPKSYKPGILILWFSKRKMSEKLGTFSPWTKTGVAVIVYDIFFGFQHCCRNLLEIHI